MSPKILLFYPHRSSFIKKDIEILSEQFDVIESSFAVKKKIHTPFLLLKQFFFLLANILKADLVILEFAGYHSFLPSLFATIFNKPSLIIVGGMDCVSFPSIHYGNFNKKLLGIFTKWSYHLTSHIAPKHESLLISEYTYQKDDFPKQGIQYFCPQLKKPFTIIHNGYDSEKWYRKTEKRKNSFISVSGGFEYPFQVKLKGIDLILEVAQYFPQCEFTIIGIPENMQGQFTSSIPEKSGLHSVQHQTSNIIFLPPQPNEKLIDFYSQSEFYLQLSMAEGFPNALSEAMLCECIPIGSNVFSIPEIIADTGFILKEKNIGLLKKIIEDAIVCDKLSLAKKARQRILENYSLEKREEKLLSTLLKII